MVVLYRYPGIPYTLSCLQSAAGTRHLVKDGMNIPHLFAGPDPAKDERPDSERLRNLCSRQDEGLARFNTLRLDQSN